MGNPSIYEIHDPRFRHLIVGSAALDELYSECRWAEGPVWFADLNCLVFSDIPNERMLRYAQDGDTAAIKAFAAATAPKVQEHLNMAEGLKKGFDTGEEVAEDKAKH